MPKQRLDELIARQLSGEATDAELAELQAYLREHSDEQFVYEVVSSYWNQHPDLLKEEANDEEERFQRIVRQHPCDPDLSPSLLISETAEVSLEKAVPLRRRWLRYAAAIILVAGSSYVLYHYGMGRHVGERVQAEVMAMNEVVAKPGSRSKVVLPDGTQVWLNAESRISYNPVFNRERREVNLEGEAFFDVTHDASKPFIVHTSGIDIKVLGTAFNVKSYATDGTIEATLLRGSIEVVRKNDPSAPKVILRPHEKLVFTKEDQGAIVTNGSKRSLSSIPTASIPHISVAALPPNRPDSVIKETSWLYDKLNFEGDNFEELASKLERWYDVVIVFRSERLKKYRLKGSFERETIVQALEALKLTTPFEYHMKGKEIEIINR